MAVKKLKPITPGQRFRVVNKRESLTGSSAEKTLLRSIKKSGGRNNSGKMTVRNIGGGHKKRYRVIDFKRDKHNIPGIIKTIEYDPNRSCYISLVNYVDGEKRYIISPNGINVGSKIISGDNDIPIEIGNVTYLKNIPLGTVISCIELVPGNGACLARSAGSGVQLVAKEGKYVTVKLPSGEVRMILSKCMAMIGNVSNPEHQLVVSGKAGRSRWLGRRPRTRPVAMNPVDHPMGGGEGKASGGHPRTRKGIPAKGYKTRNVKKKSQKYIVKH